MPKSLGISLSQALQFLLLIFALGAASLGTPILARASATAAANADEEAQSQSFSREAPVGTSETRFRIQHYAGRGVGYDDSYSTFGVFSPLWTDDRLCFVDGELTLNNDGRVGGNVGFGLRRYDPDRNRIRGMSVWYDADCWNVHKFYQVGASFESLGEWFDFRTNVYVPVSNPQKTVAYGAVSTTPTFGGNHILFERLRFDERALTGLDMEWGTKLPGYLGDIGSRAYAGWYHFQGGGEQTYGAKGRVEGYLAPNLALQLEVTGDPLFRTNVVFGVTWFFGANRHRGAQPYNVRQRLFTPVERHDNVVVADLTIDDPVIATDTATGNPFFVVHADSSAPLGGDGTFENPLNDVADVFGNFPSGAIVYLHADSVFDGQASLVLQDNQRLLGEGNWIDYYIDTEQFGQMLLPRATSGIAAPQITNSLGNAVILANDNEIAGFDIRLAGANGIFGDGVTGFDLHENLVQQATLDGISIVNAGATGQIHDTFSMQNTQNGISVSGGDTNIAVSDNSATDNGNIGILVHAAGNQNAAITGNTTDDNGNIGMVVETLGDQNGEIRGNYADDNGNAGIVIDAGVDQTGNVVDNVAGRNGYSGTAAGIIVSAGRNQTGDVTGNVAMGNHLGLAVSAGGDVQCNITNNTASYNNRNGLQVRGDTFNGAVSDNYCELNGNNGLAVVTSGAFRGLLSGNESRSNTSNGIYLNADRIFGDSSGNLATNNTVVRNGEAGLAIASITDVTGNVTDNRAGLSGGSGILIEGDNVTSDILRNQAIGNKVGIEVNSVNYTGDIQSNTASTNTEAGIIATARGSISDPNEGNFTGNISHNTATRNGNLLAATSAGIRVNVDAMTGNITFNDTSDTNGGPAGLDIFAGAFFGDISNNTSNDHGTGNGILINTRGSLVGNIENNQTNRCLSSGLGISVGTDMTGNISGNIANENGLGIGFQGDSLTGDIRLNQANENATSGLQCQAYVGLTGDVVSNSTNDNGIHGLGLFVENFVGNVTNCTANRNGEDGLLVQGNGFQGTVQGNHASDNGLFGIDLTAVGTGPRWRVDAIGNSVSGNNGTDSDFRAWLQSTQASDRMCIRLEDNVNPGGQYRITGGGGPGTLTYEDLGQVSGTIIAAGGAVPGVCP